MKNQRQNIGRFIFKDDPMAFLPFNQSDKKDESVSSYVLHKLQDLVLPNNDDEYRSMVDPIILPNELHDVWAKTSHHKMNNYLNAVSNWIGLDSNTVSKMDVAFRATDRKNEAETIIFNDIGLVTS